MKSVRVFGQKGVAVDKLPDPQPHGDFVVVKVMASAISGTERRYYDGSTPDPWAGARENGGHEAAGVVWKVARPGPVREGDRVALFGAYRHCGRCRACLSGRWLFCQDESAPPQAAGYHAQYVTIRSDFCLPLPDEVSFEAGALLAAPFGAAFRSLGRTELTALDRVLVMGQGPLGLAVTLLCRFLGAQVIAADTNDYRLACARACDATATVNPSAGAFMDAIAGFTRGAGVEVAIDCTGSADGRLACLEAVGRGGRVGLLGIAEGLQLDAAQAGQLFAKEIALSASWYVDPAQVLTVADLVVRGLEPARIITHRFPIEAAAQAFATGFGGEAGKVVILPWGA